VNLVVDASVAVAASATPVGFARFRGTELIAPPLLWIEVVSALHSAMWRGELRREQARTMLQTYDANYVALARILGCRLVTLDARLRRGTARLGFVVGPTEI
jgi:predicted nucleic acid-binding protein